MFKFGENWASFSKQIDETRLEEARQSLNDLFGDGALKGASFLDIGCGSGLFSIAAAQSGARTVRGIDVDPVSVQVSMENAGRWLNGHADVFFQQISALDRPKMESLGKFDVVYSWGVLHHSGDMSTALTHAARSVKPGGLFMIAIYNRHWSSPIWTPIKWLYNRVGAAGQKILIWILTPIILAAKWLVTFKNPLKMRRGMDFIHNIIDWVGGYPYEYASVSEMTETLQKLGFEVLQVRPAGVPTGSNKFVCRMKKSVDADMNFTPQFYDKAWEGGWNDMKVFGPTARHTRRLIFRLLRGISFNSVLDAGCGTGVLLQQIFKQFPHTRLAGSEYSPQGIEFARKRLPDVEFHALDLSKQSLDEKFDLITCIDVLEHIPDDRAALKNLLNMTAGHLILAVPLGPLFKAEVERMGHVHGYSRKELELKIAEAGFDIVRVIQWGFPFYTIHRRVANRMPQQMTAGDYSPYKKFLSSLIYGLFFLNLPLGGERYYVLCRPAGVINRPEVANVR